MITWEPHRLLDDERAIFPSIGDFVPKNHVGIVAERICLDLTPTSRLSWEKPKTSSYIFWDCDLGLLSSLTQPLEDSPQCLALKIALEHLSNNFLPELLPQTLGINLYSGPADFSHNFPWTPSLEDNLHNWVETELSWKTSKTILETSLWGRHVLQIFCRNVLIDYLHSLIPYCPADIPLFMTFHSTESLGTLGAQSLLLSPEVFKDFILITDMSTSSLPYLYLESQSPFWAISRNIETDKGCVIPSFPYNLESFNAYNNLLSDIKGHFRQIPEESLHLQWEGLNSLTALKNLRLQTQRKLQGFAAAGGEIELT